MILVNTSMLGVWEGGKKSYTVSVRAIFEAVGRRFFTAEAVVQSRSSPCGIRGSQICASARFPLNTLRLPFRQSCMPTIT